MRHLSSALVFLAGLAYAIDASDWTRGAAILCGLTLSLTILGEKETARER